MSAKHRLAALSAGVALLLVVPLAAAPAHLGADGASAPAAAAAQGGCDAAIKSVKAAAGEVRRAQRALARAKGAKAERKARRRLRAAKEALQRAERRARRTCSSTAPPQTTGNRAPEFPDQVDATIRTEQQRGQDGTLLESVTTIEVNTPATDAEGDPITYTWAGDERADPARRAQGAVAARDPRRPRGARRRNDHGTGRQGRHGRPQLLDPVDAQRSSPHDCAASANSCARAA